MPFFKTHFLIGDRIKTSRFQGTGRIATSTARNMAFRAFRFGCCICGIKPSGPINSSACVDLHGSHRGVLIHNLKPTKSDESWWSQKTHVNKMYLYELEIRILDHFQDSRWIWNILQFAWNCQERIHAFFVTPLHRNSAAEKKGAMFTQVHPGSPLATIILVRLVSKFHHYFTVNRDENHHPKGSLPFFEWWLTSRVTQKYSVSVPCMLADNFSMAGYEVDVETTST